MINNNIRLATIDDLVAIRNIIQQCRIELGYVRYPALRRAIELSEVYVNETNNRDIIGFCEWHRRRDGYHIIYSIAVDNKWRRCGMGKHLFEAVPHPKRLKCPTELEANDFYARMGMVKIAVEDGNKRALNVWQML